MFTRRNRSSLRQALEYASDSEMRSLRSELAQLQEGIAQIELDLFDTRAKLALFERDLEARVRPLERRLQALQSDLSQARHRAERRAQWGARLEAEELPDVVEQFHKAWTPGETPPAPKPSTPLPPADQEQLKRQFRELAKRFHPDLSPDPGQKLWRQEMMGKVNAAYAAGDLAELQRLAQQPDQPPPEQPQSREGVLVKLSGEIRRLSALQIGLKNELDRLLRSQTVQLQLEVSMARLDGRDMLGEIASDLQLQIARAEAELASLG
ncbi:MAG TPA: J domain-containing protein [Anaerolineales bacterium]|nr:J domain-containing protein [Anaerolineales bacterium]